ncbi:MAG: hypothetical protein NC410_09195 [Oscillibacter sp.]|nr:hypothetical protein [Oscillibacter sp.]
MEEQGFIKLSRRFFKNILWKEPRTYSRAEAWLYLIYSARFEASKEIVNNRVIEVRKGELVASRRFLEKRWNWGSSKVINFLNFLKSEGMINHRQTNGQTIITLCNYEFYNDTQTSGFQENKPPTNHRQTSGKPPTNQNKESKEREEGKEYNNLLSPDGDISLPTEKKPDIPTEENQKKEKSSAKKERKVFIPPSVDEVSQYCKENNYTISPWRFVNYYTSNGWMVGKNKMKDWKAAVRTWQSKENENGNRKLPSSNQVSTGKPFGNSPRNDAANKRAELDNLEKLAEAVLRGTNAPFSQ